MGNRLIRVVHVVGQLDTGGMERLLVEFARQVDRSFQAIHFVNLGPRGKLTSEIESCGWPVVSLNEPPGLRLGLPSRLARLFGGWRADVVHTHNTKSLLYGAPGARLAGVSAVIHTRHGPGGAARRREHLACRLAVQAVDRFVCVSRDSARLSVREGVPPRQVRTIWNGIDLKRFAYVGPQPAGPAVVVSRLSPEKDVGTLLRAAALVVDSFPEFRLEVVGGGPCLDDLRRTAADLGLNSHVTFLGERRDVAAVLRRAAIFVLPSLMEGISIALLEAMGRGLPVVATRVGGTPEVVLDGETGILVPPAKPDILADAILRLLCAPQAAMELGRAGHRRVEDHFDLRRTVGAYDSLYREVLASRNRLPVPA